MNGNSKNTAKVTVPADLMNDPLVKQAFELLCTISAKKQRYEQEIDKLRQLVQHQEQALQQAGQMETKMQHTLSFLV